MRASYGREDEKVSQRCKGQFSVLALFGILSLPFWVNREHGNGCIFWLNDIVFGLRIYSNDKTCFIRDTCCKSRIEGRIMY